jgi:hypothetical protein
MNGGGSDRGLIAGIFRIFALAERANISFLIYLTTLLNCSDYIFVKGSMPLNDEFRKKRSWTVLRNCPSVCLRNKPSSLI